MVANSSPMVWFDSQRLLIHLNLGAGVINKSGLVVNNKIFLGMLGTILNRVTGNNEYSCLFGLMNIVQGLMAYSVVPWSRSPDDA